MTAFVSDMRARLPSFSRRSRPRGAAKLRDRDGPNSPAEREGLGHYQESPARGPGDHSASMSSEVPAASRRLSGIMSEQQAIISRLRELIRSGRGGDELMRSAEFPELVTRLECAQAEQKQLLSPQYMGGENIGAAEQRLLIKQGHQMMELLVQLTSGSGGAPGGGEAASSSCGSSSKGASSPLAASASSAAPQSNPFFASTPQPSTPQPQPSPMAIAPTTPTLIDFS